MRVLLSCLLLLQSSGLRASSRDYSGSDIRSSSWKVPSSLTATSRTYERPWAESSLSGSSSRRRLVLAQQRAGQQQEALNLFFKSRMSCFAAVLRSTLRVGRGRAPLCWTPPTTATPAGRHCPTAAGDFTRASLARLSRREWASPAVGWAVAEVLHGSWYFRILVLSFFTGWENTFNCV